MTEAIEIPELISENVQGSDLILTGNDSLQINNIFLPEDITNNIDPKDTLNHEKTTANENNKDITGDKNTEITKEVNRELFLTLMTI